MGFWGICGRGEGGVGKSALLEYAAGAPPDLRENRAIGVESEMELAFAGLHQLCLPLLDRLGRLPAPQRDALGVAVLTLLLSEAADRPLLCLVDDAQWLDRASAQVLAFVARRLLADPVGLLFAARDPGQELEGLPDLEVRGLREEDARGLLHSVVRVRLDERGRDERYPAVVAGVAARAEPGAAGGRLRADRGAGGRGADRGELPVPAGGAARRHALAAAGRRGRTGRRPGAGPARGRAARHRGLGCRGRRSGRVGGDRDAGAVPSSAGAVGGVPVGIFC